MPLVLEMAPETQTFTLEEIGLPDTSVTIRQATTNDNIWLDDLFAKQSQKIGKGESAVEIEKRWNYSEYKRARVFRTLIGSNIAKKNKDGEVVDLFTFAPGPNGSVVPGSEVKFFQAYGALPQKVADAIYAKVLIVNPEWDAELDGEGE